VSRTNKRTHGIAISISSVAFMTCMNAESCVKNIMHFRDRGTYTPYAPCLSTPLADRPGSLGPADDRQSERHARGTRHSFQTAGCALCTSRVTYMSMPSHRRQPSDYTFYAAEVVGRRARRSVVQFCFYSTVIRPMLEYACPVAFFPMSDSME